MLCFSRSDHPETLITNNVLVVIILPQACEGGPKEGPQSLWGLRGWAGGGGSCLGFETEGQKIKAVLGFVVKPPKALRKMRQVLA